MEKGRYQKLKLLYLLEILRDYSDENTYLSVKELTSLLLKKEIVVIIYISVYKEQNLWKKEDIKN